MADLKKVAFNTTYYTLSTILLRASSIIFFPIFSLYLSKSDYGTFSVVTSLVLIVGLLGGLGLNRALTRFIYYDTEKNDTDHDTIIYTTLVSNFIGQFLFISVFLIIGPYLFGTILKDISFYPYVFLGLITIPLNSIVETARVYFKSVHEGRKAFILDISFFSTNILFNLFFVVGLGYNVLGLFLGVAINALLFSIILVFTFYSKFKFRLRADVWKGMIRYAVPLLPFTFLNVLFDSVDKLFLNANSGSADSGIYYLALTLAMIFSSFKESVISALTPWVFENMKIDTQKVRSVFNLIMICTGLIGFLISLFSKEILIILSSNPDFIQAHQYVPFTIISFYIIFIGQLFNIKTFYFGNYHKYLFIATLLGICTEFLSCYFLIPIYGIHGAVFSRIVAFSFQTLLLVYYSKKEKELSRLYNYKFMFISLIILSIFISMPTLIDFDFLVYQNILIKTFLTLILFVITYFLFRKEIKDNFGLLLNKLPILNKWIR